MTVEECNGRLEGKRGGHLTHEGVEDVAGDFVIINGLSDKDHNFEVDPAWFGEKKNKGDNDGGEVAIVKEEEKNGDGGCLRGNGEDLVSSDIAEEKDEAMEKSVDAVDDDLERYQGGETLDVEAQVLSEESDVHFRVGSEKADADNELEPSSAEEVAGADTGIERGSGVAVGETDNRSESDVDVTVTDSLVESKVAVAEDILESEVAVNDTGNREESEVTVPDTDSRLEPEVFVADTDSHRESEVTVLDTRLELEVAVAEQIDNSEVRRLEPEPELSVFDNDNQKESQSQVEVEVKESEIEVRGADHLEESELDQTIESSVSESREPVIQETRQSEVLLAEGEKVGASEVVRIEAEEQKVSNISESLPVESEVDEMPSSTADAPTYESSNSQATNKNCESDSIDYDAPTAEKDENLEVVDSLEVDESNGCTIEIETVTVTEKEPEEIKTKIAPEKETGEDTTDAATQAAVETAVMKRHHIFMVKVPRFTNDEQLQEKIHQALSQLEEKTRFRDSVQEEIRKSMVIIYQDNKEIVAASAEENAARLKYNAKRKELEGVQVLLNRINCAVSITDIDEKIRKMVHMQQHETIALRQEKQYINEINQLKRLREQLSLKSSSQEQTDNTISQRSEIERQFENLKKELAPINDSWRSAKDRKQAAWKRCNDEKNLLRNLRALHQVANGVRQEVYVWLLEQRKRATDKFKHFGMYKADQNAAATYSFSGDDEGLRSHCDRQVERIMELWNNNDNFRKEYMKSNVNSTLRRLGTLDGRSLGLDEETPAIISHLDKRPNNLSVLVSRIDSPASDRKQEFPETQELASTIHSSRTKSSKNLIPQEVISTICDHQGPQEEDEKEGKQEELARKEDQLRKDMASAKEKDAAAELKEKLILEQKAKAKEAEDRKKWKEEKNKTKAEQRLQKEAELREQKKARKEMKRTSFTKTTGYLDGQTVSMTDIPSTSQGGAETKRRPTRVTVAAKQERVQSLPLPLRNRGRRKMTAWLWAALIVISVLLIFLAGYYPSF